MKDMLLVAHNIVNERGEEANRQYGPMSESMDRAACIASLLTKKQITAVDMFKCMIALKLAREAYAHKTDNLLDAAGYMAGLENYFEEYVGRPREN